MRSSTFIVMLARLSSPEALRAISSARWAPSVRRTVVRHEAAGSDGPPSTDQENSCAQLEPQASRTTSYRPSAGNFVEMLPFTPRTNRPCALS